MRLVRSTTRLGDPDRFVNFVVVIEPDGTTEARYDKVRRVPFGEYVPMRLAVRTHRGRPCHLVTRFPAKVWRSSTPTPAPWRWW